MKIDQHPFPANMLDAKGKTKVLTSEAAEKKRISGSPTSDNYRWCKK
jgi:hypothetical protein